MNEVHGMLEEKQRCVKRDCAIELALKHLKKSGVLREY